jgi:hypothetical protein
MDKMNKSNLFFILVITIAMACSTSKKTITATVSSTPSSTTTLPLVLPVEGIYPPGNEELLAIQMQFKEVTLAQLKEGHTIYTQGACINCHGANNIYLYEAVQWKSIVDDMASKAYLSATEKEAVYKYILAIKAKQPK